MGKQAGFRVGLKERRVTLVVEQCGQECKLTHVLRHPTTEEWIDYDRRTSEIRFRGRKTKFQPHTLENRIGLYDKCVIRTEGYLDDATKKPLTAETPGWKDKIPSAHKSEVIGSFGEISSIEDAEGKN